jgi:hypothetical protein
LSKERQEYNKYALWPKLRKWTVPIHWGFGFACAVLAWQFFPAGMLLLGIFAGWEGWNDWADKTRDGCQDWHESFLTFCMLFFGVILPLHIARVIAIRWWF